MKRKNLETGIQGFLPLDEFYFTTAEKKIAGALFRISLIREA
jgi:hypothetical protein